MKKKTPKSFPVALPKDLCEFVEDQVRVGNFSSASSCLVHLLLMAREQATLESHLLRAVRRGGRVVVDANFWREKQRRLATTISDSRR